MRWAACRGWQAFPRASDACDRDGSLLLLKLIVHPKGTRQVESVSADDVGRYAPPQRSAAQCGLPISAPSHGRPVKPHPIQLCSSCFSRPAPLVLRLFSVAPKGPRLPAPHAGKIASTPGRIVVRRRTPKGATHSRLSRKEGDRRAAHGQEFGGRRLRRRFAASSHHLGIREPETHRHQRLPPRQRQRQRHAAWPPSGLRRHAVSTGNRFAARPPPQDSASPQVLVNGVEAYATGAGLAATSVLCPRPSPRFYAAPPYAAEHCSTFANPQTLYAFAGLWPFYAVANLRRSFTPSSICIRLSGSSPACEG